MAPRFRMTAGAGAGLSGSRASASRRDSDDDDVFGDVGSEIADATGFDGARDFFGDHNLAEQALGAMPGPLGIPAAALVAADGSDFAGKKLAQKLLAHHSASREAFVRYWGSKMLREDAPEKLNEIFAETVGKANSDAWYNTLGSRICGGVVGLGAAALTAPFLGIFSLIPGFAVGMAGDYAYRAVVGSPDVLHLLHVADWAGSIAEHTGKADAVSMQITAIAKDSNAFAILTKTLESRGLDFTQAFTQHNEKIQRYGVEAGLHTTLGKLVTQNQAINDALCKAWQLPKEGGKYGYQKNQLVGAWLSEQLAMQDPYDVKAIDVFCVAFGQNDRVLEDIEKTRATRMPQARAATTTPKRQKLQSIGVEDVSNSQLFGFASPVMQGTALAQRAFRHQPAV